MCKYDIKREPKTEKKTTVLSFAQVLENVAYAQSNQLQCTFSNPGLKRQLSGADLAFFQGGVWPNDDAEHRPRAA